MDSGLSYGPSDVDHALKELYNMAMVFELMRKKDVYTKFQTSNLRIYKYIHDRFDGSCGPAPKGGWAPAYKSFISSFLSGQAATASASMATQYSSASSVTSALPYDKNAVSQFIHRYPTASWGFNVDQLASLPSLPKTSASKCSSISETKHSTSVLATTTHATTTHATTTHATTTHSSHDTTTALGCTSTY